MPDRASFVFPFEDIDELLTLLPLSARRALDHSGYRLSLEGYQSLPPDVRRVLGALGAQEKVDGRDVEQIVRRSTIPATKIKPVPDPDVLAPPEQLLSATGGRAHALAAAWPKLRALERFALVHIMRRSIAHDDPGRLEAALDYVLGSRGSVVPNTQRSERPPPPAYEDPSSVRRSVPAERFPSAPPLPDLGPQEVASPKGRYSSIPPPMMEAERRSSAPPPIAYTPHAPRVSNHLGATGEVHMVDVGAKGETARRATAIGAVFMRPETAGRLSRAEAPKGEVLATARVAGIMAAKRTPELIPLCHHVALTHIEVLIDIEVASGTVTITTVAEALDRTGVEMEALVAASVACLTIYDMLKGIDRSMVIGDIKLLSKSGGKQGQYVRREP